MIKVGFDFDNTIINYDNLFHEISLKKGLIPKRVGKSKESIKNFLTKIILFSLLTSFIFNKNIIIIDIEIEIDASKPSIPSKKLATLRLQFTIITNKKKRMKLDKFKNELVNM